MYLMRIEKILHTKSSPLGLLPLAFVVLCFYVGRTDSLPRKYPEGNIPVEDDDDSDATEKLPFYDWTTRRRAITEVYLNLEIGQIESNKPADIRVSGGKKKKVRPKNEEHHRRRKIVLSEMENWAEVPRENEEHVRIRDDFKEPEVAVRPSVIRRYKGEQLGLRGTKRRQKIASSEGDDDRPMSSSDGGGKRSGSDRNGSNRSERLKEPHTFGHREVKPSRPKMRSQVERRPTAADDPAGARLKQLSPEEYDYVAKTVGDEAKKWAKAEHLPVSVLTDPAKENFCMNGGTGYKSESGGLMCLCPGKYTGDRCELVDECLTQPCGEHQLCEKLAGSFRCVCTPGFVLLGRHDCIPAVTCAERPCRHHGQCRDLPHGDVQCICRLGYTGSRCQKKVPECDVSSCAPDETCVSLPEGFQCFKH